MKPIRYNPSLHIVALLTAAATFPLIFMGGLVTSHQAGMSVPDWPNTYGYNMFTFPPSKWIGGIFYEHTHRLMGALVGMLSIVLCVLAWRVERRAWVRWLATGVLAAVIVQGVLGGLRVILVKLDLAIVHACMAQAFFCLAALVCVVTSRWWTESRRPASDRAGSRLITFGAVAICVIFLQLIVGATMRHYGAGLAIPDLPLAYGQILPPASETALADVNAYRAWELHEGPVTLTQIWLHFSHRVGAILVSIAILALAGVVIRRDRDEPKLLLPAILALILLGIQITLGVLTVLWQKPADIASAHVAIGALTLVTCFVLTIRAARLRFLSRAAAHASAPKHAAQDTGRPVPVQAVPA